MRADSAADLQPLAKNIDEHFTNSDYETRTLTESDAVASGLSALGNIRAIVFALCAVVVLTVLLIAANSTAMMVRERISEVAVMRSLGFSRGAISVLLFGECGLDWRGRRTRRRGHRAVEVSRWSHARRGAGRQRRAVGDADQAVNAVLVAVAVSLVSGLVPIIEALRISPAMAFRKVT